MEDRSFVGGMTGKDEPKGQLRGVEVLYQHHPVTTQFGCLLDCHIYIFSGDWSG